MSDFNFDENTINKVKNMMDNGELDSVMSKISPEMIQNFSSMLNGSNNTGNNENHSNSSNGQNHSSNSSNTSSSNSASSQGGFDFSNIDINTVMKMKSIIEKMNDKNDPRSNLLYSLKPYLRDEKKEKLDQYANLMNVAKIAELLKNDDKGTKK